MRDDVGRLLRGVCGLCCAWLGLVVVVGEEDEEAAGRESGGLEMQNKPINTLDMKLFSRNTEALHLAKKWPKAKSNVVKTLICSLLTYCCSLHTMDKMHTFSICYVSPTLRKHLSVKSS